MILAGSSPAGPLAVALGDPLEAELLLEELELGPELPQAVRTSPSAATAIIAAAQLRSARLRVELFNLIVITFHVTDIHADIGLGFVWYITSLQLHPMHKPSHVPECGQADSERKIQSGIYGIR